MRRRPRPRRRAHGTGGLAIAAGPALVLACAALTLMTALAGVGGFGGVALDEGAAGREGIASAAPSALARREIPASYLQPVRAGRAALRIDWAILAGIGKVECDHGRDRDPSCGREGSVNSAGAGGPMQFIASTWSQYGVDGDGDGRIDRWDAADAIDVGRALSRATGAPGDYRAAIFAYNHAGWYVAEVEAWAARYRGSTLAAPSSVALLDAEEAPGSGADTRLQAATTTAVQFIAGARASLAPGDGHLALIPVGAPSVVQAMLVAANELQALPYGPGGHPDPRGAREEDCSSTINYVLYSSGVRPIAEILRENPLAQDYVRWGLPGPGRWVTIYATTSPTDHAFITIAGLRLDTSHNGTDVGPNRDEDGPRWRLLDRIPTWAHWSVRHPPGL